jgi:hypothetical protein
LKNGITGHPIRAFYINMLKLGLTFSAANGQLKVGGNKELLTPVVRAEIVKRAEHLADMLTPAPHVAMTDYFGRLLKLTELTDALKLAERIGERVDAFPLDGGWLLITSKETKV